MACMSETAAKYVVLFSFGAVKHETDVHVNVNVGQKQHKWKGTQMH